MCETATLERIAQAVRDLPEDYAREVLDFAEFLKARRGEDETAYLLREPANARRLLEAAANIRTDEGGKQRVSAVLPIEEYQALLERLEDLEDLAEAREVLERVDQGKEETIPWKVVKAEYGL